MSTATTSPRRRNSQTAREAFGEAMSDASPNLAKGYEIAKARVMAPTQAALGKMSKRGRAGVYLLGLLLTAIIGAGAVNSVARPAIAAAARATLGPGYVVLCIGPAGRPNICPGQRR